MNIQQNNVRIKEKFRESSKNKIFTVKWNDGERLWLRS
jgi:hypothetical protein